MRTTPRFGNAPAAAWIGGLCLAFALAGSSFGQAEAPAGDPAPPLARYVPARGLVALVELDGLDVHDRAWRDSAAFRLLNETPLGAMFEDLARQVIDRATTSAPPEQRTTGAEVVQAVERLFKNGLVAAVLRQGAEDFCILISVRGGARGELRRVFDRYASPKQPAPNRTQAGRTIHTLDNDTVWWAEKEDLVVASAEIIDDVLGTLDGRAPSALTHRVRAELRKAEGDVEPVAIAFADIKAMPPMPPEAIKLGLDGLERIDYRLGFQGDALVSVLGIVAPAPRRGVLALLDQPTIGATSLPPLPAGLSGFTVLSLDPVKTYDRLLAVMKATPPGAAQVEAFENAQPQALGLRLRDDLLVHLGPKIAVYATGATPIGPMGAAFPDLTVSIEARDREAIGKALDRLIESANRALAAPGPRPNNRRPPGAPAPEFRKAEGPRRGYVLRFPAGPMAGPLASLAPTILVGDDRVVIATKSADAEAAAALPAQGKGLWTPTGAFEPLARHLPRRFILLNVDDPRVALPAMIAKIPALLPAINAAFAQSQQRQGGPGAGAAAGLPIEINPLKVPNAEDLSQRLFPASVALVVDDRGARLVTRQAIPSLSSPASTGVLVALLLPAVQASREAARRAQCVNNLKQIGLALHNYHAANNALPRPAITDKQGKPLLSWRVAILPYVDQQELYNKFKRDEPWDSPHNRALLREMPPLYLCPSRPKPEPFTTTYRVFAGPGTAWEPGRTVSFQDVTDGTSNTVSVVEAREAVPWTKPDELGFDPAFPTPQLDVHSDHPGGYNVLFMDGSVRFLKTTINPEVLRLLITRAGNEVLNADNF